MVDKVMFIIPPIEYQDEESKKRIKAPRSIPYGVLSIISYLNANASNKRQYKILDLNLLENRDEETIFKVVQRNVAEFQPSVVGISALFNPVMFYLPICLKAVKESSLEVITIIGGGVATNCYELLLEKLADLDAVCYAEGELPFLRVLENNDTKEALDSDVSFITRKSLAANRKPVPSFINDLDLLPLVDFSYIDINKYEARAWNAESDDRALPIHTTRGCPFNCVFCTAGYLHGKRLRKMSPERVENEIVNMVDKYQINKITIDDDQFLADTKRAKEILRRLIPFGLKIEMEQGLSVRYVDDETVLLLKHAGLQTANLAIESGSEHVLHKIIDKPSTNSESRNAIALFRKYDIDVKGFFIFGLIGERPVDRQETVDFIIDSGLDWALIQAAQPLRGSRLYTIALEHHFIDEIDIVSDRLNFFSATMEMPGLSKEELNTFIYKVNLDVNFIRNYNMRSGNYQKAISYFETVCNKYPTHAIAHYCISDAYEKNGEKELSRMHFEKYIKIIKADKFWFDLAREFSLRYT